MMFSPTVSCSEDPVVCGEIPGNIINPYYEGVKGNWRFNSAYLYNEPDRDASLVANMRDDGMHSIIPFWKHTAQNGWVPIYNTNHPNNTSPGETGKWLKVNEVTKCDIYGTVLEAKDPLGLSSASLFSYNYSRQVGIASNAKYQQIASDGFEDYSYYNASCHKGHLNFYEFKNNLSTNHSHTGKYSMTVNSKDSIFAVRSLTPRYDLTDVNSVPYKLKNKDCMGTFSPYIENGNAARYVVGCWVKEGTTAGTKTSYPNLNIKLMVDCSALVPIQEQRSNIIDGWQRIEQVYKIPATAAYQIKVIMENKGLSVAYFDDVRFHPFLSSMQTYVYDEENLNLVASLDEQNFATYYEYDQEGKLMIVKQETEKGIYTLNEYRGGIRKK